MKTYKERCIKYFSLSDSGDYKESMKHYYRILREAELVEDCKMVLIAPVLKEGLLGQVESSNEQFMPTLFDKMYRSASGLSLSFESLE